ncbi:NAD(P)-binding domain-containing protein [Cellulosimicrobium sp. Marseille-Q4280]|uniref:NADPH-dependent F420 reductase n=1 Tax=Cellulosimicrobium sp. Marseille-Q4280 TaxID=2937992 RepID=UPI00203F469B|nr:NAD(P)-binding domain-containing protein [Cellulosimicrobium sp. Marseille-Q4280]
MSSITIVGAGNMGSAVASLALAAGSSVQVLTREPVDVDARATTGTIGDAITGDVVVLALPYPAVAGVLDAYDGQLDGTVLVDLTNPLDFATFDALVVPAGSSAAAEIQARVPGARVLKAFNTTFAATLASGQVGPLPTTVLVAGDDADAKAALAAAITGVRVVDAGSLKRAHELEALGFLQLTLAAAEKTSWTSGFALAE